MGRPENFKSRYHPSCLCIKAALRQASKPACAGNGGKPVRSWQGRSPLSLHLLESDSARRALPGLHHPRLAEKVHDAGTLFRTAFVLYNVPQEGGFVKGIAG